MAWGRTKTEHTGPKRGKGYWGRKAEAKQASRVARRGEDRRIAAAGHQDTASESQRGSS
jgi:hypothetical protein